MTSFQRIVVVSSGVSTFPACGAVLHLIFYDFIIWQAGQRRASVPAQRPAGTRLTLSQKDQQHKHSEKPDVNNKNRGEESFVENNLWSSELTLPDVRLRYYLASIGTSSAFVLIHNRPFVLFKKIHPHIMAFTALFSCLKISPPSNNVSDFLLIIYKVKLRWLDSPKIPKAAPQKRSFDHQWQSRLPSCHQRAPKAKESEVMP